MSGVDELAVPERRSYAPAAHPWACDGRHHLIRRVHPDAADAAGGHRRVQTPRPPESGGPLGAGWPPPCGGPPPRPAPGASPGAPRRRALLAPPPPALAATRGGP